MRIPLFLFFLHFVFFLSISRKTTLVEAVKIRFREVLETRASFFVLNSCSVPLCECSQKFPTKKKQCNIFPRAWNFWNKCRNVPVFLFFLSIWDKKTLVEGIKMLSRQATGTGPIILVEISKACLLCNSPKNFLNQKSKVTKFLVLGTFVINVSVFFFFFNNFGQNNTCGS